MKWMGDSTKRQCYRALPAGFREAIVTYYREMERLAVVLEEIMAEAL
jgi:hypothetical protein